jgi:hypothetical protein
MSVPEDRLIRKRFFSGLQGYIALKRMTTKQLQTGEFFLKFFKASVERKRLLKLPGLRRFAPRAIQVFAIGKVAEPSAASTPFDFCRSQPMWPTGAQSRQAMTVVTAVAGAERYPATLPFADTIIHHTAGAVVS